MSLKSDILKFRTQYQVSYSEKSQIDRPHREIGSRSHKSFEAIKNKSSNSKSDFEEFPQ